MATRNTPAARMTRRARWYLSIASGRHLLIAVFALLLPATFESTSFLPILEAAPLWFWGIATTGAGVSCAVAAWRKSASIARLGLMWSATLTSVIAFGLVIAWNTGDLTNPSGAIVWAALAAKDFIACGDPLRSPFEDAIDRIEDGDPVAPGAQP